MSYFSKNLIFLRNQRNMSRVQLSEKLKVNQSTVSRWENEDMGVTVENAFDVANFFGVSIADLTGKDLSIDNSYIDDEDKILFEKFKTLSKEDKELVKNIIETRKRQIDEEKWGDKHGRYI